MALTFKRQPQPTYPSTSTHAATKSGSTVAANACVSQAGPNPPPPPAGAAATPTQACISTTQQAAAASAAQKIRHETKTRALALGGAATSNAAAAGSCTCVHVCSCVRVRRVRATRPHTSSSPHTCTRQAQAPTLHLTPPAVSCTHQLLQTPCPCRAIGDVQPSCRDLGTATAPAVATRNHLCTQSTVSADAGTTGNAGTTQVGGRAVRTSRPVSHTSLRSFKELNRRRDISLN